jgi:hypothetical protein
MKVKIIHLAEKNLGNLLSTPGSGKARPGEKVYGHIYPD